MDILEILQTVALCLNSLFLLVIMFMIFKVGGVFLPPTAQEIEEMQAAYEADYDDYEIIDNNDLVVILQTKTDKEIDALARKAKRNKGKG